MLCVHIWRSADICDGPVLARSGHAIRRLIEVRSWREVRACHQRAGEGGRAPTVGCADSSLQIERYRRSHSIRVFKTASIALSAENTRSLSK